MDLAVREALAAPPAPDPAGLVAMGLVDRVDRVVPAAPVTTDLAVREDRVDQATTDLADRADRVTMALADPAAPVTTGLAGRAAPDSMAPAGRGARAVRAPHGTAMTTAATSVALPGATDPHPGVLASRRGPHGTGHFRLRVDRGTTGRSTTGATRKRLSGASSSTSSALTSSECGSRCKDSTSPNARFADRRSGRCPVTGNGLPTT
jgi:hypothetical protein